MPLVLCLIAGSLLVTAGILLLVIAVLGARETLRRNRWLGVRTAATLRSDASFRLANRVGAAPIGAAGAIALAGGAVTLAGPGSGVAVVVLVVSIVGMLGLAGVGGAAGHRAAMALVPTAPEPSACAGTCAGCELVAGCSAPAATASRSPEHP